MSFILLGVLNAQAVGGGGNVGPGGGYWFDSRYQTTANYLGKGVAVDSNNSVIRLNHDFTQPGWVITKSNSDGIIQWARQVQGVGEPVDVTVDSADNIIALGSTSASDTATILKLDTNGNLEFFKGMTNPNGYIVTPGGVTTDPSNNIYVTNSGQPDAFLATSGTIFKFDSAGNLSWQRRYREGLDGVSLVTRDIVHDGSSNIYISGTYEVFGGTRPFVLKMTDSSNFQWDYSVGTMINLNASQIAIDSTGKIIMQTQTNEEGTADRNVLLATINSSGAWQWKRVISNGSNRTNPSAIATDSSGIYVTQYSSDTGSGDNIYMQKYDTSGNLAWQRRIEAYDLDRSNAIDLDSSSNIYSNGRWRRDGTYEGPLDQAFGYKLPNDGSLTGNYNIGETDILYEPSSLTIVNGDPTEGDVTGLATYSSSEIVTNLGFTITTPTITQEIAN